MTAPVLVVGGGMVGLAFAIAIKQALKAREVIVLEARPLPSGTPDPLDSRASALNLASVDILTALGVWSALEDVCGVIRNIHVSNQHRFGSSMMEAADVDSECLGFVAENHLIGRSLKTRADALGVEIRAPVSVASVTADPVTPGVVLEDGQVLAAGLVVIADGGDSGLRDSLGVSVDRRSTDQSAMVANVTFPGIQANTAFERFTAEGPLALLPLPSTQPDQQRFNLVWSMSSDRAVQRLEDGDTAFLQALQEAFGWRLGKLSKVGRRNLWQLDRVRAREQYRQGCVIAGNAAHGIHPVAGQGLNLSLRDAATLSTVLMEAEGRGEGIAETSALARYQSYVQADQERTVSGTDLLSTLFSRRGWLLDLPRDTALASLDLLPRARRQIARIGTASDFRNPLRNAPGNPTSATDEGLA